MNYNTVITCEAFTIFYSTSSLPSETIAIIVAFFAKFQTPNNGVGLYVSAVGVSHCFSLPLYFQRGHTSQVQMLSDSTYLKQGDNTTDTAFYFCDFNSREVEEEGRQKEEGSKGMGKREEKYGSMRVRYRHRERMK